VCGSCLQFLLKLHPFRPRTANEDPEGEQMYSCTLSLTSALDGVGGQGHATAALPPGKTRYPLHRRLGGHQGRSGRCEKSRPPAPGFDPHTVQPIASRYTDWAIPAHFKVSYGLDSQGTEPWWGEIWRTLPDWPWGPPNLLYNGNRVFPGVKEGAAWR